MSNTNIAGKKGIDATHTGGKGEIFHDWFPYLEGFSKNFVVNVLNDYIPNAKHIIEPFFILVKKTINHLHMGVLSNY